MEKLDYGATAQLRAVLRTLLDQLGRECAASTEIAAIIADEKVGRRRSSADRRKVLERLGQTPGRIEAAKHMIEMLKDFYAIETVEAALAEVETIN